MTKSTRETQKLNGNNEGIEDNFFTSRRYFDWGRRVWLFFIHYKRRYGLEPIWNPWRLNLGRFFVQNVFIIMELIIGLDERYELKTKNINGYIGKPFLPIRRITLN